MENVMKKRKRTANMKRGKLKGALLRANWIASLFVKVIYLNEINWILNDPFNESDIKKLKSKWNWIESEKWFERQMDIN